MSYHTIVIQCPQNKMNRDDRKLLSENIINQLNAKKINDIVPKMMIEAWGLWNRYGHTFSDDEIEEMQVIKLMQDAESAIISTRLSVSQFEKRTLTEKTDDVFREIIFRINEKLKNKK